MKIADSLKLEIKPAENGYYGSLDVYRNDKGDGEWHYYKYIGTTLDDLWKAAKPKILECFEEMDETTSS